MRAFIATTVVLLATVVSAVVLPKRDKAIWQSPFSGTIVSPAAGSTITPSVDFAFDYAVSNWCESAFSPFAVYITQEPPSFANVTSDGTLADGTFALFLGKFTVSNFGRHSDPSPVRKLADWGLVEIYFSGLPLDEADAPPPTLVIPTAAASQVTDTPQQYLSVIQEFDGCPVCSCSAL